MRPTILLARHGHHAEVGLTLSGRSDIPLDQRGHVEAAALADRIADLPIAAIASSPRVRARQTAAPAAARIGLPIRIVEALDEIDFGWFSGRSFADLDGDVEWARWNAERNHACCPGGETMEEAVARALDYLAGLAPEETPILCVTHCDLIRGIVAHVLGLDFGRMFAFDCDPGSLTMLARDGSGMRLVALNEPGWRVR